MGSTLKIICFRKLLITCILAFPLITHGNLDTLGKNKYLPHFVKLQYAGGIGFISPGIGYTFFNEKLDITGFYGYVPKHFTKQSLHSISIQSTVKPFQYSYRNATIYPFNVGFFLHHTFGSDYWVKLPSHYPDKYYWWSPGRMGGLFLGGEVKTKRLASKALSSGTAFYFRVGSRGLYIVSLFGNTTALDVTDILELGFGITFYR